LASFENDYTGMHGQQNIKFLTLVDHQAFRPSLVPHGLQYYIPQAVDSSTHPKVPNNKKKLQGLEPVPFVLAHGLARINQILVLYAWFVTEKL